MQAKFVFAYVLILLMFLSAIAAFIGVGTFLYGASAIVNVGSNGEAALPAQAYALLLGPIVMLAVTGFWFLVVKTGSKCCDELLTKNKAV